MARTQNLKLTNKGMVLYDDITYVRMRGDFMAFGTEISDAEYQVMKVIWSANVELNTNEVVEKLAVTTSWKPKTVHTLLSRLVKKGALKYEKVGRVFVYASLVEESEILAKENDNFLSRFYDGALNSMVVNLLAQDKLSDNEIAALRHILDEKLSDGRNSQ